MIELHCRPPLAPPSRIVIGRGAAATLLERARGRTVFALIDDGIATQHAALLDPRWTTLPVRAGEALKSLAKVETVLRAMVGAGLDRGSLLVAFGGGTIGDLGGFCSALYLRGIECWQVPTTLMGMVDSAVGGKTAVNLPEGKNLVGAVHPPALVIVDPTFVASLPEREFRSGLAEAIKMAIGVDAALFARLEQDGAAVRARDLGALETVIHRALAAKAAVVEGDLREDGARRVLNLGHTVGHALEALADYREPHGLCVARGLHFALDVATQLAAIAAPDAARCRALLAAHGHLPTPLPPRARLEPFLRRDKKLAGERVHFVVPTGIGRCEVRPLAVTDLLALLAP